MQHERVTVTVHGQPSAVLLSPDDLAMLEETIAVLGDADLMTQLAAAEADLAAGRIETQDDLEAADRSRRHLTEDLPEAVAAAAFEFITGPLVENPHRVGKQLHPPLADRHSARRGTSRILYRIDDQARTVTVLAIDRGEIYRA